eukprot:GHVU01092200.1.p3 GENE.GHVU01092200.1~~GHVU01092200.1.p3  ORF type:complete len:120 (+),score=6.71 GHVU01092200.1:569-928(+)
MPSRIRNQCTNTTGIRAGLVLYYGHPKKLIKLPVVKTLQPGQAERAIIFLSQPEVSCSWSAQNKQCINIGLPVPRAHAHVLLLYRVARTTQQCVSPIAHRQQTKYHGAQQSTKCKSMAN